MFSSSGLNLLLHCLHYITLFYRLVPADLLTVVNEAYYFSVARFSEAPFQAYCKIDPFLNLDPFLSVDSA